MTPTAAARPRAWAAGRAASAAAGLSAATAATRSSRLAATASTPKVPSRGSLRMRTVSSRPRPPRKASAVSPSPSSWNAPVTAIPAVTATAAATSGGSSAPAPPDSPPTAGPPRAPPRPDRGQLAGVAGVVHAGPPAGERRGVAAEQGGGDRRGGGGVADAYLAEHQQVGVEPGHRPPARVEAGAEPARVQGRLARQVAGRVADADVDDVKGGADLAAHRAGGGGALPQRPQHGGGDLRRVGADALAGDAVVGGEHHRGRAAHGR